MKQLFTLRMRQAAGVFTLIALLSCEAMGYQTGSGNILEETRDVGDFSEVRAESFLDVYLSQGSSQSVMVKADDNIIDKITVEVKGSTLVIGYEKGSWNMNNITAKVYVTATTLNGVKSTGSSDIIIESDIEAGDFELESSGSSDIVAKSHTLRVADLKVSSSGSSDIVVKDLVAEDISATTSGSSDIELAGEGDSLDVDTGGSSDFVGKGLTVKDCIASAGGSSDITIAVTDNFEGSASGASDITYYGNPKTNQVRTSGAADIHRRN
ncbi:MAG: head GIN domain-containing protein [Bacteroidota bacterium]